MSETTTLNHLPPPSSNSAGVQGPSPYKFRPRKASSTPPPESEPAPTSSNAIVTTAAKRPRLPSRFSAPGPSRPLSADGEVAAAVRHLRSVDPLLATVIDSYPSLPVFDCRLRPFVCLVRSILHQQLAVKAADSVYSRFLSILGASSGEDDSVVHPFSVLTLSSQQLRQIGVSPRKASYLHDLARKYTSSILSDEAIARMDDRSLFSMLTMVNGIGVWSVQMFMIYSLNRPDVLPSVDLAFRKGVQALYGLEEIPRPSKMEEICEKWRPYRTVGAWYVWQFFGNNNSSTAEAAARAPVVGADNLQHTADIIDPIQMLPGLN